ncbi:hypothetical protein DOY81_014128, partial [Sarcophaga bullata]
KEECEYIEALTGSDQESGHRSALELIKDVQVPPPTLPNSLALML